MSQRSPTAYFSSDTMSSVLRDSGIGSCRVGSTVLVGAAGSFGWAGGVVTGVGVGCSAGSGVGC